MNQAFLDRLRGVINTNISNPDFGVKELAIEIGMSHTNLLRKVRSSTGKSINQLIREVRLKKAMELIHDEDIQVSELAFRVGFSSHSYFTASFKKYFGMLPGGMP